MRGEADGGIMGRSLLDGPRGPLFYGAALMLPILFMHYFDVVTDFVVVAEFFRAGVSLSAP